MPPNKSLHRTRQLRFQTLGVAPTKSLAGKGEKERI